MNIILFVFTIISTTTFGYALSHAFAGNRPFEADDLIFAFQHFLKADVRHLVGGLAFSFPLLTILMAHELGHYLICANRNVEATLPFFLPSPTLFGTLGAFIRIKTPIYSRRDLFDIGIGGPLAGFAVLVPFLAGGLALSRQLDHRAVFGPNDLLIAHPYLLRLAEWLRFSGYGVGPIVLHPMAVAALAGMLLTALNLLPIGQLDGGHVVYALFGERVHKYISLAMILVLVVMGKFYFPWWIWAGVLFFLGRKHPLVFDENPVNTGRRWLAFLALVIFVVSVSVAPTRL